MLLAASRTLSRSSRGSGSPLRICSLASGFSTLLEFVRIDLVVSRFYGRCSPGFSFLFRGIALFVLRSPYKDLCRCSTSTTSPALLRFFLVAFRWAFYRFAFAARFVASRFYHLPFGRWATARGSSMRFLPLRS